MTGRNSEQGRAGRVRRRRMFYIPGYDPFPPRRYRELYRSEGAAQAQISGYDIALEPRREGGDFGWRVQAGQDGAETVTDVTVLTWSDIVRGSMRPGIVATYALLVRTAWTYIATGALWRLMRLRKGPVIAALYPIAFLLGQLALALAAGWGLWLGLGWIAVPLVGETPGKAAALIGAGAAVWAVLDLFRRRDSRFFAYYLMHDYAHSARHKGAYGAELDARISDFANRIGAALTEDVDEVLIVGHSSGAHIAVSALAELLRKGAAEGPALSLLTLGQVVPMVAFLPHADRLRGDLGYLATQDRLAWVDVTAPGDGCAFALCDPVAVSGQAGPGKRWPLVFSAQFTRSLSPARWKALRWRFFRLHFQYLCAFDAPLDYDYFRITAGPMTLRERYEHRPPSRSRIEKAVSKYTGTAP